MSERLAQLPLLGALILLPVKVIQAEPPKDPIARSVNGNFVRTNPGGEHALLSFGREFKDRQGTPNAAHDLLKVREWIDANTAILYSYSQWFVGDDQGDLDANFLFTLKFDAERNWKIVKTHRMSEKEVEKKEKGE